MIHYLQSFKKHLVSLWLKNTHRKTHSRADKGTKLGGGGGIGPLDHRFRRPCTAFIFWIGRFKVLTHKDLRCLRTQCFFLVTAVWYGISLPKNCLNLFYLFWPAFTSQFERGQQDLHAKVREGIGQKAFLRLDVQVKEMDFIFGNFPLKS